MVGILDRQLGMELHDIDDSPMIVFRNANYKLEVIPKSMLQLCVYFTSIFPKGYGFEKDTIIQLWIASGFIKTMNVDNLQDVGYRCFNYLVEKKLIVEHGSELKYKGSAVASEIGKEHSKGEYLIAQDEILEHITETVQHLNLVCHDINEETNEAIHRCNRLQTLFLSKCSYSDEFILIDLFSNLDSLCSLDMSGIKENVFKYSYSLEYLTSLRYLDLSGTAIRELPESFNKFDKLQTLKLNECFELLKLHSKIGWTMSLRHLYLQSVNNLYYFPPGMGNLTNLETLSIFPVNGRNRECSIRELKKFEQTSRGT